MDMNPVEYRKAGVWLAASLAVGAMGLGGCVTTEYVDERIVAVNARIDTVDAKATDALSRADAAAAAAAAAAADARNANQRLDQLEGRVHTLEQRPLRTPRG